MMALEDHLSKEPQVYHIEIAAFAASEQAGQHDVFDLLESLPQDDRQ